MGNISQLLSYENVFFTISSYIALFQTNLAILLTILYSSNVKFQKSWSMIWPFKKLKITLGYIKPPEKAMATHSSTLACKIPWMEEAGSLKSMGSLRVRHNWATSLSLVTFMHWRRKWQPIPVFLPGESQGQRSLVGCRLWGHTESDTTEATWQQQHIKPQTEVMSCESFIISLPYYFYLLVCFHCF